MNSMHSSCFRSFRVFRGSYLRLEAIRAISAFCGSANFAMPSRISTSSSSRMSTFSVDLGQHGLWRQLVDLARERPAAGLHGGVGRRRIGLDVGAGERLDVLPRRVGRLLRAGAGEDHLLLQRQLLVGPELLVQLPDALGVDDADQSLRGRRQLRARASRCRRRAG